MSNIIVEERGHLLLIGINRPEKKNSFVPQMMDDISLAYARLEDSEHLRCGVLYAVGDMFTAGLDLAQFAPLISERGELVFPENGIDPFGIHTKRKRSKPMVAAVQGLCLTLGIEVLLASDVRIAASNARFGQIEVKRGIFPFGGATLRLPEIAGWGNAMRWLLTGELFDAAEAYRIGLVQEIVEPGTQFERAVAIAETIAKQAPLGVYATLRSAWKAQSEGFDAAAADLMPETLALFASEDAQEGVRSFMERREGDFKGK